MFGPVDYYEMNEDITVLTKDDFIHKGKIVSIDDDAFTIANEKEENIVMLYSNMKNIANSDWLADEDIRG